MLEKSETTILKNMISRGTSPKPIKFTKHSVFNKVHLKSSYEKYISKSPLTIYFGINILVSI